MWATGHEYVNYQRMIQQVNAIHMYTSKETIMTKYVKTHTHTNITKLIINYVIGRKTQVACAQHVLGHVPATTLHVLPMCSIHYTSLLVLLEPEPGSLLLGNTANEV